MGEIQHKFIDKYMQLMNMTSSWNTYLNLFKILQLRDNLRVLDSFFLLLSPHVCVLCLFIILHRPMFKVGCSFLFCSFACVCVQRVWMWVCGREGGWNKGMEKCQLFSESIIYEKNGTFLFVWISLSYKTNLINRLYSQLLTTAILFHICQWSYFDR